MMSPIHSAGLPYASAFRGRTVFVTGHTGFKGSWLTLWLAALGARVRGYALAPDAAPNNFVAARVQDTLARHTEGDIRDFAQLSRAFNAADPDVVFHLAAQPLVRESYTSPRETFEVNVAGTSNILECVRQRAKPCVVVVITTDKCYENREQVWGYRESDSLGGHDPYSASKSAAELVTASYRQSFFPVEHCSRHGIKIATARSGNVIGGGDWACDRIVPDIVRSLTANRAVSLRNPHTVRPWQHVLEPLSGYLTLAAAMLSSHDAELCTAWNFGPRLDDDATVAQLATSFCHAWGAGTWRDDSNTAQPHETKTLRLSIEKALFNLQWKPVWRFGETVARTAAWYREFYAGGDMRAACLRDIDAYAEQAAQRSTVAPRGEHFRLRLAS